MIEGSELTNLIFSLVILSIFWTIYRKSNTGIPFLIDMALLFVLFSSLFTVLEGFMLPVFFNLLEHIFYLVSFLCILVVVWKIKKAV